MFAGGKDTFLRTANSVRSWRRQIKGPARERVACLDTFVTAFWRISRSFTLLSFHFTMSKKEQGWSEIDGELSVKTVRISL